MPSLQKTNRAPVGRMRAAGCAAVALALFAGGAQAAPKVLDHVPADAPVVISIGNVGELLNDIDAFNVMLGDKGMPEAGFVTMMGRGMPGLNLDGSAAVVLNFDPENPDAMGDDDVVILVPVSDFGAFTQQGAADNGVVEFMLGDQPAFARQLGDGFAAMGPAADAVRGFAGDAGRMGAHSNRLGHSGLAIADTSDVTIIANVAPFRPRLLQGMQDAQQQAVFYAGMSAQGQDVATPINAMMDLVRAYVNDAQTGVVGISYDAGGVTLDLGTQFTPDSDSAKGFDKRGDAATLLNRVPGGDYYLAYAMDLRSPELAKLAAQAQAMSASMPGAGSMPGQPEFADIIDHATGTAGVMGTSPALMSAGVLSNMVSYVRTNDAAAYAEMVSESLNGSNGQASQGMSFATSYTADAKNVQGVPVDSYAVKISVDQAAGGNMGMGSPQQMIGMMFGPSQGPNGHIARLDSGVIQTVSPSTELLERAIGAAKNGNGLGADGRVMNVSKRLPEHRMGEAYLSLDQIFNSVGPIASMFGVLPNFQPAPAMDPVAMGVATIDGGVHMRTFIPNDVIKTGVAMAPERPDAMDDGWGDEPADEDPEF